MFDFYERRKLKGIFFSKAVIVVFFILGILISISAYERFKAERETAKMRDERTVERERLEHKAAALGAKVERLESERGIEEEIREQFDIAKGNETVVVIIEDERESRDSAARTYPLPETGFKAFLKKLKFW